MAKGSQRQPAPVWSRELVIEQQANSYFWSHFSLPESLANVVVVLLLLPLVCVAVAAVVGAIVNGKSCARARQKKGTNPNHKIHKTPTSISTPSWNAAHCYSCLAFCFVVFEATWKFNENVNLCYTHSCVCVRQEAGRRHAQEALRGGGNDIWIFQLKIH